jgi:nucleotide-binding universal stress UspA family protein
MEVQSLSAASNLILEPAMEVSRPYNAKLLRQWCAPETILAVTNFDDEEALLFHLIRQARPGRAKVLLVHAAPRRVPSRFGGVLHFPGTVLSEGLAQQALDRMARQLRWVGVRCEPVLLRGTPTEEITALAKARGADRVLLTTRSGRMHLPGSLGEEIAPGLGAPVCVVPERVSPGLAGEKAAGRIMLALSLRSNSEMPLAFASRLAQEQKSHLTVMHVFPGGDNGVAPFGRSPTSVASRLSSAGLREAALFCPLEIVVREGDPAEEILRYQVETIQDYIVLAGPRSQCTGSWDRLHAVHRIVSGARCPVIMLGQYPVPTENIATMAGSAKPPQSIVTR